MFSNYVVNQETGAKEDNPRKKIQVEPRQQFFACFDSLSNRLYLSDIKRKNFLEKYLNQILDCKIQIKYTYKSLDDFCKTIKTIKGFRFTQTRNLFTKPDDLFSIVGNQFGQDLPDKMTLKVEYSSLYVINEGMKLLKRLAQSRNDFDEVVVIGCNDEGIEESYNFESLIQHIDIELKKDTNEHFNVNDVRDSLLEKLRKQNV